MFDKRNRWIINLIMGFAVLCFVGLAILPLVGLLRTTPTTANAPANAPTSDLEAQARGYELVLEDEPDNQTALRNLLRVRRELGDVEGTIAPLEKLAELNPTQPEYTILLAQAKQQVGDREGAAQAYRSILTTQPGNIYALQGLAALLIEQERPEAAIGLLQDTLRNANQANQIQAGSVDLTSVRLLLGQVYAESDRYNEAIAVYEQAIQSDRQDFRPVLAKALVLQAQGKDTEAQPLFTTAASLAPAQYKDQINQLAAGGVEELPPPLTEDSPSQSSPAPAPAPSPEETPASTPE
ncbi:tetratricopeptide repeat protein [Leptolyngbya sp. FACHB-671]|uniref:tetratricopeptide repeat protein n=1 Tax=Leptolyngbya sp. FACHB-671 TaxID=2692812 RepID=UPI001688A43B|nr:tetratricopeptide repeat protein [Leptolyngbya sp. FACHB-671]